MRTLMHSRTQHQHHHNLSLAHAQVLPRVQQEEVSALLPRGGVRALRVGGEIILVVLFIIAAKFSLAPPLLLLLRALPVKSHLAA